MTDYYVNATTGSDSNPGTQAQPFKTIGEASSVATAGATVHVAPGTYSEEITTTANGTATAPIRFVSDTKNAATIVPPTNGTTGFAWWVEGNYVTVDGFQVKGSSSQGGTPWTVGIYLEGSNDTATNDTVHDIATNLPSSSQGAAGIDTDDYNGGTNDNVTNSTVYNIGPAGNTYDQGIYIGTAGNVFNNLVYDVANVGIHLWHDATHVNIANNTVFGNTMGILVGSGDYYNNFQGPDDYTNVFNNIVYDNTYGIAEEGNTGTHNTYKNNLVYMNTDYAYSLQNGNTYSGNVAADPQFVKYIRSGGGDYRLTATSPAIGAGIASDAGVSAPSTDILDNLRLSATGYDIGAYEHTLTTTLATPTTLTTTTTLKTTTTPTTTTTLTTTTTPTTTYSIKPSPASVNENAGLLTFTVTRANTSSVATVYASTVQNQGYTNNGYFDGIRSEAVNFSKGQSSAQVSITINDLGLTSGSEKFGFIVQQHPTDPTTVSLASDTFTIHNSDINLPSAALTFALNSFAVNAGGWTSEDSDPRELADVNGDGKDDIVGFGSSGVYVALATGNDKFASPTFATSGFGTDSGGWTSDDTYPRKVADVNGDGRADIVGFGSSGVYVALANANGGFGNSFLALPGAFGTDSGGWTSNDTYPRQSADVNGDGRADVVGFGSDGVYVALGNADGSFGDPFLALPGAFSTDSAGWTSDDAYPRELADVNGDGRADIVGFWSDNVYTALGKSDGTFGNPVVALPGAFGTDSGRWTSNNTDPRELADVNGDGRADIVAFGSDGVYTALGKSDGTFQTPVFDFNDLGASAAAGGWTSQNAYPRLLGDVTGDHKADVAAFGSNGVYVADASTDFLHLTS